MEKRPAATSRSMSRGGRRRSASAWSANLRMSSATGPTRSCAFIAAPPQRPYRDAGLAGFAGFAGFKETVGRAAAHAIAPINQVASAAPWLDLTTSPGQTVLDGEGGQRVPRGAAQFGEHVLHVAGHGVL